MSRLSQCLARANSHLRYWAYRRSIGNPITLRSALRAWLKRFAFEWCNLAPPDDLDLYGKGTPLPLSELRKSYERVSSSHPSTSQDDGEAK